MQGLLPLREIHKSGRFDCPGAGLGESDKSFLRYRRLRAMDWFYADAGCFLTFFARLDFFSAVLKALKGRIAVNCSLIFLTANDSNLTRLRRSIRGLITRMLM